MFTHNRYSGARRSNCHGGYEGEKHGRLGAHDPYNWMAQTANSAKIAVPSSRDDGHSCWSVPEINDQIIDHASDDKATLAACVLVSRSFYSRSAMHLFESVTIVTDDTLLNIHREAQSSLCRFYVKALTLGRPKPRRHRPHCACPPPLHIDGGVLFDLIAALPNLRPEKVMVEDVLWKPVSLHHLFPATTAADSPNQLYVLSLVDASRKRIASVNTMLLAVPPHISEVGKEAGGVGILEVKAISLPDGPDSRSVSEEGEATVSPTVDMVVLIGDLNTLNMPSVSGPMTVVDGLTMRWQKEVDLSLFDAIECGQKLSLSSYRELHSVNLWVTLHPRAPHAWQQWQAYLALLLQVPGDQVLKIAMGLLFDGDAFDLDISQQVKATRWGMLSSVLPRFPNTRHVEITVIAKDEQVRDEMWSSVYEGLRSEVGGPGAVRIVRGSAVVV